MARTSASAFSFIVVTVTLDALAGGIAAPVLPRLLAEVSGGAVQDSAAIYGGLVTAFALVQLFAGPMQGAISDWAGRRPVILAANIGLAASMLLLGGARSVIWLFAAYIVAGAMSGSISAGFAYVADVSTPDRRAARYGFLGAAMTAAAVIGPVLGGVIGQVDLRAPFWGAAAICGANALFGFVALPESLPPQSRAKLKFQTVHPVGAVLSVWRAYPILRWWSAVLVTMTFAVSGLSSIFPIYVATRFHWSPQTIGLYASSVAVVGLVSQAGLAGLVVRRFGEATTILAGLAIQSLGMVGIALGQSSAQFWLAASVLTFGAFAGPAQMALLSRIVRPDDRGRLSGANRALAGMAAVAAPSTFAALLAYGALHAGGLVGPNLPFQLAAVIMIAGGALSWQTVKLTQQFLAAPQKSDVETREGARLPGRAST